MLEAKNLANRAWSVWGRIPAGLVVDLIAGAPAVERLSDSRVIAPSVTSAASERAQP